MGEVGGFVNITSTPRMKDIGCEGCHGPAGAHKYSDHDLIRPGVTIASEVCGGCHTDAHHPTYDEWSESGHAQVTSELQVEFSDPVTGPARYASCGGCHSGAARVAMLNNYKDTMAGNTNYLALPTAHDAALYGQTCAVCHDPHVNSNPRQLRNPIFSTNFFALSLSATTTAVYTTNAFGVITTNIYYLNTSFVNGYNPNIQVCGQCHNNRAAVWTGTSRPPHHSPQYNILIGAIQKDYLNGTNITRIGAHGLNPNGCAQCHMEKETPETITDATPVYTGHRFEVSFTGCTPCHASPAAAAELVYWKQTDTLDEINTLVGLLDTWGTNYAPAVLKTNYGRMAWETTTPGTLSNPTGDPALVGPSTTRQASVPNAIKQARYNLYMVYHDASLGVHNPSYVDFLLYNARTNITAVSK